MSDATAEEVERVMKELGLNDGVLGDLQSLIDRDKGQANALKGMQERMAAMNRRVESHNHKVALIKSDLSKEAKEFSNLQESKDFELEFDVNEASGASTRVKKSKPRSKSPKNTSGSPRSEKVPSPSSIKEKKRASKGSKSSKAGNTRRDPKRVSKLGDEPQKLSPTASASASMKLQTKAKRKSGKARKNKRPMSMHRPASPSVYKEAATAILSGGKNFAEDSDSDSNLPFTIPANSLADDVDMYGSGSDSDIPRKPKRMSSGRESPRVMSASARLDAAMAAFGPVPPMDPDVTFEKPKRRSDRQSNNNRNRPPRGPGPLPGCVQTNSRPNSRRGARSSRRGKSGAPIHTGQPVPKAKRISRKRAALASALRDSAEYT